MKVLVCGDRNWNDFDAVERVLDCIEYGWERESRNISEGCIDLIIEGGAEGADSYARDWAHSNMIECKTMKADWDTYGKAAGPIRNKKMLAMEPHLVVAFHSNIEESKGTKNMLKIARKAGVLTILVS